LVHNVGISRIASGTSLRRIVKVLAVGINSLTVALDVEIVSRRAGKTDIFDEMRTAFK
jgi:hypothetical protein